MQYTSIDYTYTPMYTYTYIYTYIYTYTYTYIYTYILREVDTCCIFITKFSKSIRISSSGLTLYKQFAEQYVTTMSTLKMKLRECNECVILLVLILYAQSNIFNIYTSMHACIYIYTLHIHTHVNTFIHTCMHAFIYTHYIYIHM